MTTANDHGAALTADAAADAELEALFRGRRDRFVAERNAAAKRLRAQGLAPAAQRLEAQAKPSISAWVVNQLWWRARPEMEALLDASRRMAAAMRTGPAAQAAAGQARRRALEALETAARGVLDEGGHSTGMSMLRRIATTLEALAAHAVLGGGPVLGRLTQDLEPPGFELLMGLGAASVEPPLAMELAVPHPPDGVAPELLAMAQAEREHAAASERVTAAADALDEATRAADEALLEAERVGLAYAQAQAQAQAARQRADEAERVALRVRAEAKRGRERVEEARRGLASYTAELERHAERLRLARLRVAERRR